MRATGVRRLCHLLQPDESDEYWTDERCFILELSNDADDLAFLCICTPRFQWPQYESLE